MMDDLRQRRGELSPAKLALALLQKKKAEALAGRKAVVARGMEGIPRRDPSGPAPVSFAQQRLWLLDRLEPGGIAYNMPSLSRLRGLLEPSALERAIGEIVRRHDSLRTTFAEQDGEPTQVVAPPSAFRLPLVDLLGLPEEPRRIEERRLLESAQRPFDLEKGPLFRAMLVRLADREHLLLLDMHHIVSDGWSFGVFFRELGTLYAAFCAGEVPSLPGLPVQYTDFAVWQREWLQGPVLEEQLSYWRSHLADAPPALELPLDRVRPAVQTHRGGILEVDLPFELVTRLRELSLRQGTSLFMTLVAALQLLLSRLSGQEDVIVGSPSAGRSRTEVEGLIGLFLNTLVLRTDLSGEPTFRELLGRVKDVVLGAYRYQAIPFERLLEELQPERLLSRTPIFQVLFNFVSISDLRVALSGVEVEEIDLRAAESKFDFTLYVNERTDSLRFGLVYNADLFEQQRMEEMLRQLEHLLAQAVATPEQRIGVLSLVTPAAAALLPDPYRPLGGDWHGAVHHALARRACRQPDRISVRDASGVAWTYAELEAKANRLARLLLSRGVEKGDSVAVWAHRSAPLVQMLMGTLKAGAAFMILDPAYPVPRLLDYLRIGRPAAWIAVPGAPPPPAEVEEAIASLPRLCSVDLADLAGMPETDPDVIVGPDDAACITFTSGSTGVPKGVVGRHGSLTYFYPWMGERFELGENDRFGMLSALSHDPLQRDVFTPIWFGGQVVVPEPESIGAPGYLAGWLRSEGVTVLHLTPAMMEMVLDSAGNGVERVAALPDLRRAFVVGDLLKRGDVEHLQDLARSVVCVNLYGSTETNRSVSYFVVPRGRELGRLGKEVLPLGRGMEGSQLLVLSRGGRLAGVGEAGEIYIRSRHLAQGYLGDETLTVERFRPNPLVMSPEEGDRVYRTGDLGRYMPDGGVELVGRADFQVKLRGFRIELGEVEAALARFPEVRECVVVLREDRPGHRRLVAYLVPAGVGAAPSSRDLRAFLAWRLPDYMVPSAFVALPALPLTCTGKVDRRALPVPAEELPEVERPGERSPVEELLAGIWADLLGVPGVAPHASFFEIGGHSLLATRMISRVRAVLGVELPMRAVFEEPTLAAFAALAERARRGDGAMLPPLVRVPRSERLPTSFSQQRLWFLDRLEAGSFAYNLAGAVRLEGSLDVAALAGALGGIVHRHESLRTRFVEEDGQPWQLIAEPSPIALPVVDLAGLSAEVREEEVLRVAGTEARRPYDLARGPMMRSTLLRLGEREHALLAGMHHIVSDGWSMSIFLRELSQLYRALVSGRQASLPELPIQYADYAVWQRHWLNGDEMEDRIAWWRQKLAGAPPVLELPLDHPRPPVQSYRGSRANLAIGHELEGRLEALSRRLGVTPFMVLLAGFATLLTRHGSQTDMVVGTPIANRALAELEDLIGFFASMLAMRVDLSGDPTFAELAVRVREMALGAYARQDIPFESLVSELKLERDLSRTPVFQAVLALQNLPESDLDLAGLTVSPLELDFGRAQFDLALFLVPLPKGGLLARLDFVRDLFDVGTVQRLLGHFHRLLQGVVEQGGSGRLSELPMLVEEEREQVLTGWNRTAAEIPEEPVHRLFRQWAERTPDALAVAWKGGRLTYGELADEAGKLASRLRGQGVGPETVVALCLERSSELITAALAVLEVGGAYLPVDPAQPAERVDWILRDSGAVLVLTSRDLFSDSERERFVPAAVSPDRLAYVIYTSGSTGLPKGTELRHRGLSNLAAWHCRTYGLKPGDRCTLLAGPGFDASVWETWAPLAAGASLHVPPPEIVLQPQALLAWMAEQGITISFLPTPLAEAVLSERLPQRLALRTLLTGGDRLLRRPAPDLPFELINHYGPTESTVVATAGPVAPEGERVPEIGSAISNTRVYILDAHLQPVPLGVPGELCLSGEGLARGYRGRPELTAERFVPNPFSSVAGERLYRTGDLARLLHSGQIEFQGRTDHQVKIRGFRIELGEIEAALVAHPDVEAAVVVAREDAPGDRRLVAYLVPGSESIPDAVTLRSFLESRLPAYMIPVAFVILSGLPLTPNGKVDRRALPAPELPERGEELILPRTPLEEQVADVWREVLGVELIGISDSFWDLGGHSLLATKVLSRLQEALGTELPLQALFESPTLAGFAEAVGRHALAESEGSPDLQDLLAELEGLSEVEVRELLEREVGDSR